MINKRLKKYSKLLVKRIYRPIKPIVGPLLKKIKMIHVFLVLVGIGLGGSLINGFIVKPQERASFWPWSSRSHSEMAMAWFEAGNEEKAVKELQMANKLFLIKTRTNKESLDKAETRVMESEKIREEIKIWEGVLETMPSFKDVFLRLAVLKYQLYENEESREYFNQAEYLDPNDEEVLEIKKIIF